MSEQDAETPLDRDVQEFDQRLGELEERIDEAKGKAEDVRQDPPSDAGDGPPADEFPRQFDDAES